MKYIRLAILLGLASGALAQPYSHSWDESNKTAAVVADASSSYTLDWQDTAVPAAPSKPATPVAAEATPEFGKGPKLAPGAVEAPVAVNLAALPGLISAATGGAGAAASNVAIHPSIAAASSMAANRNLPVYRTRALRGPSAVSVPEHDITLHAERYFDTWADNYRYVNRVEVVTYRGGFPRTEVYENTAQYSTYDVYINDLKQGDRYEVRVTWDDGKYRIIDRSIGRHPERFVRVSTPW